MPRTARLGRLAAGTLVVGVLLSGCGGPDEPDTSAVDAFCAAAARLDRASGDWRAARAAARAWREVGLPDDAPANVRRGFALGTRLIIQARNDKQVDRSVRRLSPAQHDDLKAVDGYLQDTCSS
ncbi:MAG TPA: hypothetical protein VFK34_08600 [Marmoricola sp.]|jgi:hypothetical protein|nr:hypothetical protein [Marmoricola sp.]